MALAGYSLLIALICAALVWKLKFRALYLLLVISCTQNFIVPYLYTTRLAGAEVCQALISTKEILLFLLFAYSAWRLLGRGIRIPVALAILLGFTLWCGIRGLVGIAQGDALANAARLIRSLATPLEVFVVGLASCHEQKRIAEKFLRRLVPVLSALAVIAVILFFSMGTDFWLNYVNIASYNVELKGENTTAQMEDSGVSSTAIGRPEFSFLSEFRAMGTFGDPISMAFAMAFGLLLAFFHTPNRWTSYLCGAPIAAALLLSFTRSAWIFLGVSLGVILLRQRRFALLAATLLVLAVALIAIQPLADFFFTSVDNLATDNPNDYHAAGLRGFYATAWKDPGNILGKGSEPSAQTIPESGYAFLLEHFGLPAYGGFLALCLALLTEFSRLKQHRNLGYIGQGVVLATLVTMHTSFYAFSFIGYLAIWFALGSLTAYSADDHKLIRRNVPLLAAPCQP